MPSRGGSHRVWGLPPPEAHHGIREAGTPTSWIRERPLSFSSLLQVTDSKTRRGTRKGSTSSSSSSSSSSAPPDPLSSMLDGTDPLSMFAATSAGQPPAVPHSSSTGVGPAPSGARKALRPRLKPDNVCRTSGGGGGRRRKRRWGRISSRGP